MRIHYALVIEVPDEIDADTLTWIEHDASAHDTTLDAKIARWLGGTITEAEDRIDDSLPEGWSARIEGGVAGE